MHLSKLATFGAASAHSFIAQSFGPLDTNVHSLAKAQDPLKFNEGKISLPSRDYTGDMTTGPLYSGIATFSHLPLSNCYVDDAKYDVAIVGAPFDTAVTFRTGARFGPNGIRQGSRRMSPQEYSPFHGQKSPHDSLKIVECGDVGMDPLDNRLALDKLYRGHRALLKHDTVSSTGAPPKVVTLGGDHSITFSALRAAYEAHGPVTVIHFDSHIDTWDPQVLGGNISSYAQLNHGTFLHYAHELGYLTDNSMHVGIRAPYVNPSKDVENDHRCGFESIFARDIDQLGIKGVVDQIKKRVGNDKVYLSLDIDVLDPAYAPGTGTAEPGGLTTRELLSILDGLKNLNLIGADVVEVAPPYDTNGEITVLAAAEVVNSFLYIMSE